MCKRNGFFVVLVLIAMLLGMQMCLADGASQLAQGREYQKNGQYEQAEVVYKSIVNDYPGSNYALQGQKRIAIVNIEMGRFDAADDAVDKLKTDFAAEPNQPAVLYSVAKRYEISKNYVQRAKGIYQYIAEQLSGPFAVKSQLDEPKVNILGLIESGDYSGASSAADSLKSDLQAIYIFH